MEGCYLDDICHGKLLWIVDLNASIAALSVNKYVRKWSQRGELANSYNSDLRFDYSHMMKLHCVVVFALDLMSLLKQGLRFKPKYLSNCCVLVLLNGENHQTFGSTSAYLLQYIIFITILLFLKNQAMICQTCHWYQLHSDDSGCWLGALFLFIFKNVRPACLASHVLISVYTKSNSDL